MTRRERFTWPAPPDGTRTDVRLLAILAVENDPDGKPHALWQSRMPDLPDGQQGALIYSVALCSGTHPEAYGTAHPQIMGSGLTIASAMEWANEEYLRLQWDRWATVGLRQAGARRRRAEKTAEHDEELVKRARDLRSVSTADGKALLDRLASEFERKYGWSEKTVRNKLSEHGVTLEYKR